MKVWCHHGSVLMSRSLNQRGHVTLFAVFLKSPLFSNWHQFNLVPRAFPIFSREKPWGRGWDQLNFKNNGPVSLFKTLIDNKKADWDGIKEFMQGFSDEICDHTPLSGEENENENDAESLWQAFKSQIHLGINKFIPSKIAKKKNLYPRINADLRRLIRKRNRYFKIKNRTNNPKDINHYKSLKREVQRRVSKVIGVVLRRF